MEKTRVQKIIEELCDENFMGKDGYHYGQFFSPEALAMAEIDLRSSREREKILLEASKNKKPKNETIYRHILATPLVEVLSISIDTRLVDDNRPQLCEIYGHIRVIDTRDSAKTFTLFQRDEDTPESIKLGDTLLLTPTSPTRAIVPSEYVKLDVLLYDRKAHNIVIAKEELILDKTGDECEEDYVKQVYGEDDEGTFARVHYTVFQYAVTATVDLLYFTKGDDFDLLSGNTSDDDYDVPPDEERRDTIDLINYDVRDCGDAPIANICGSVTVRNIVNNGNSKDYHSISLLSKSSENGIQVNSGGFVELSKSLVVVPAYATSLLVDVDLFHCDSMKPIAKDVFEFKLQDEYTFKKDLEGEHGRIRVRVTWDHAYDLQPYEASKNKQNRQKLKEEKESGSPNQIERLEVFSVALHNKDFKPFSFYGTITVQDWQKIPIFRKHKSCPQVCPKSGTLATLTYPFRRSVIASDHFSVRVDLKDDATEAQISNGYASWDTCMISPFLDKRVCSIVRGERGFAAVHYTAFEDAVTAIVDVKLGDNVSPVYVYGKIVTRYGTYKYSTTYDKKYYQSILFDRHSDDCESQEAKTSGSSLKLLKTVVCLPRDSSLIIEVDLTICSELDKLSQDGKLIQGSLELKPSGESHGRLGDESSYIDVFVKWSSDVF